MTRYRQTMIITIDVEADSIEEATNIAQASYAQWDTNDWWQPSKTVVVPDDNEDYYPINEDMEDN
jgi:hypothetical protein